MQEKSILKIEVFWNDAQIRNKQVYIINALIDNTEISVAFVKIADVKIKGVSADDFTKR